MPATHWCLDAVRAQRFWGEHQYHYTAPVPGILALYEALRLVCDEGLAGAPRAPPRQLAVAAGGPRGDGPARSSFRRSTG